MSKALIIHGGWDGHQPVEVADHYKKLLEEQQFEVEVRDSLECLESLEFVKGFDIFVPIWTMGEISKEQCENVSEAVASGMGLVGCHGGMCDAFRNNVLWQFMTGGNWVSHPGGDGVDYTVNIKQSSSPLVEGVKDFEIKSEHYYLHVDPAVEVLATTSFPVVDWYHSTNGKVDMPVIWTKKWGHGRVYYTSLGHHADILQMEVVSDLVARGITWANEGKEIAVRDGLTTDTFKSDKPMY